MQIYFKLYHRDELLSVRATLAEDCLSEDGGGAAHVERVQRLDPPRLGGRLAEVVTPLSHEAELAAHDAVADICRVAAALVGKPWTVALPQWARTSQGPYEPYTALRLAATQYSHHAEWRYADYHPTGPSDAATYRKDAPYG